jgi:predicted dehydrogenase
MAAGFKGPISKVLVIGVGSIGERHVRCFLKTGRAEISICDVNERQREEVGRRYEVVRRYAELDAALAEAHDAAMIAVPADLHVGTAKSAVEAGLHVLIEKPLSVSMDGVEELAEAVRQLKRVAAVGYVYRAHPALAAMKHAIAAGTFGKPIQAVVVTGQDFSTYRPAYRESYYASRARGGGAIQDALTHMINATEWLVGPVERVVADADHKLLAGVDVEDVVHVLARHGNVIGSYALNQFQAPNEVTITVVCERGTARFEYHKNRWRHMMLADQPWEDEQPMELERDTLFTRQAEAFLDAIEGDGVPLCTLAEGIQTLRVNLALINSVESNSWRDVGRQLAQPKPTHSIR